MGGVDLIGIAGQGHVCENLASGQLSPEESSSSSTSGGAALTGASLTYRLNNTVAGADGRQKRLGLREYPFLPTRPTP